ncbi:NADH dehydrogenase subunit J [Candidatus Kryptonium thompsonii]|jgi:NADH-quinone oxidoreductase subunit J|uniref:NADH-quinone oxidoreductase subunit J n=1 Tax=Candidatus Kryptonium thompsonii TaxID=1633631 RepID=A0A0P1MKK8_9BACT|nr:NADH-quinone oxidoreductase subunit J [Candidatus Kryptonium thompsoni]CUS77842.1 NADH dehydrogenase subunit J [Candidatus Kryptonium thompsoni]CUS78739.1 NADH dehydrogenase subunit J [Candidatus Kryptonium thompsoni]CUS85605.1 NADH dehydrogenase subunit J [Candidatus Kryptonium thompsoni]CUS85648.1 NADH dehydrogenase subunit J [Candidatus Kryptonium thompsoni]CUS90616.1 NADH dehydrogenase subunit J [Candidatus Kryptonium thompsoni]
MSLFDVAFYVLAFITVGSAIVVVSSRNIIYSAFALLFTFFGVAGLYVLLNADFIAVTQVLIYVGGILVLIIFGVMLTTKVFDVPVKTETLHVGPAIVVTGAIMGTLFGVILKTKWFDILNVQWDGTTKKIGERLMTDFLLPFEVASVVLLVALLGAVIIARRERVKS